MEYIGCEYMGIVAERCDWSVGGEEGKPLQKVFENVVVFGRVDIRKAWNVESVESKKQNRIY